MGATVGDSVAMHEFDGGEVGMKPSRQGQVASPASAAQKVVLVSQSCEPSSQGWAVGVWVGASLGAAVVGVKLGAVVGEAVGMALGAEVAWQAICPAPVDT